MGTNYFAVVVLTLLLTQINCSQDETGELGEFPSTTWSPKGLKEPFMRDFSIGSNKQVLRKIQTQITSLEDTMHGISSKMGSLNDKTNNLEQSLSRRGSLLEKLDKDFMRLEKVLETHSSVMKDLKEILGPNDYPFKVSNQTCGEALFAKSGYIIYSKSSFQRYQVPINCIWTIQAGHHSLVKVFAHSLKLPKNFKVYTIDLVENKTSTALTTRSRLLEPAIPQILEGPLAFIVLTQRLPDDTPNNETSLDLQIEFTGQGNLKQRQTQFFLTTLPDISGNFSEGNVEAWKDNAFQAYYAAMSEDPLDYDYPIHKSIITLSNLTTNGLIKFEMDMKKCSNDSSFIMILNLLGDGTSLKDCCKSDCSDSDKDLLVLGTPVVFIISEPIQERLQYNVTWKSDTPYLNNYGKFGVPCGGVLGGIEGSITYRSGYGQGPVRCVWIITPQPIISSLTISLLPYNIARKEYFSQLYLMQLTDLNGNALANGPNITYLSSMSSYANYTISSREVIIVFQTEVPTTSSDGFSLFWRVHKDAEVANNQQVSQYYAIINDVEESNSLVIRNENDGPFPLLYSMVVLTRQLNSSSYSGAFSPEIKLELNQTMPFMQLNDSSCLDKNIEFYASVNRQMARQNFECDTPGNVTVNSGDGIALLKVKGQTQTSNFTLDYKWSQDNTSIETVEGSKCGGVIKGKRGLLNYKLGIKYQGNERCIWLIHTPNCSSIKVALVKGGFFGDRYLVAHTIDKMTGSLRQDSKTLINSKSAVHTIPDEFFVLLFQTVNGTTIGTGFSLKFEGHQCSDSKSSNGDSNTLIHLQHFGSSHLNFNYTWDPTNRQRSQSELYVIAYSEPVTFHDDTNKMSTIIDWEKGTFARYHANSCSYDSIKFYGCIEDDSTTFYDRVPVYTELAAYPNRLMTSQCLKQLEVGKTLNAVKSEYFAFLAVYKLVAVDEQGADVVREVAFKRRKIYNSQSPYTNLNKSSDDDDYFFTDD